MFIEITIHNSATLKRKYYIYYIRILHYYIYLVIMVSLKTQVKIMKKNRSIKNNSIKI